MVTFSRERIRRLLSRASNGDSVQAQGKAMEDLACHIFRSLRGVTITHRNRLNAFATEEIDVAIFNERYPKSLDFLPNIILIEAKHWSRAVGSQEVAWFDRKLADRGLEVGILLALNGVTGDAQDRTAAHTIIAGSLQQERRLIVLTGDDLRALRSPGQLVTLLKQRLCDLAVTGTLFP